MIDREKFKRERDTESNNFACECELNRWFKENIKGKYIVDPSECVEVYTNDESRDRNWFLGKGHRPDLNKYKAKLFGIEPLKKETAEDVLRDIVECIDADENEPCDWYARAKAVLGEGDE